MSAQCSEKVHCESFFSKKHSGGPSTKDHHFWKHRGPEQIVGSNGLDVNGFLYSPLTRIKKKINSETRDSRIENQERVHSALFDCTVHCDISEALMSVSQPLLHSGALTTDVSFQRHLDFKLVVYH